MLESGMAKSRAKPAKGLARLVAILTSRAKSGPRCWLARLDSWLGSLALGFCSIHFEKNHSKKAAFVCYYISYDSITCKIKILFQDYVSFVIYLHWVIYKIMKWKFLKFPLIRLFSYSHSLSFYFTLFIHHFILNHDKWWWIYLS